MTAGVVYLKIPDSESLLALLVPRALEAVPTLRDINVFYRSVNEEFLRTPFFKKKGEKKKKILFSPLPPFSRTLFAVALSVGCCWAFLMRRGRIAAMGAGAVGTVSRFQHRR